MVPSDSLRRHLELLKSLRGPGAGKPPRLAELKAWQAARLRATYADVAAQPRYAAATAFFLEDLYGPKDFSGRDQAMLRIVPVMARILPASAVETAALAIELEALSESLDHRVAQALPPGPIDSRTYADAYRSGSTRPERERQVELIVAVGSRLDALVKKPFVGRTLKLMRKPAEMAGLGDLQDFLERGFEAFRGMGGAAGFLTLVDEREGEILSALFSGKPLPFSQA
ncbi:MAG TPA: hypothetical protein VEC19_03350 [Usitatibacter sp.]|nr:hypothetical protein [Usitatibacter sp.]